MKKGASGKENIQQTKKKSVPDITEEKERLQNLEKEYARRIQHLKMANAKRKIQARKARISNDRKSSTEIPRLEKIEIDLTEETGEGGGDVEQPTKRRRSLLELNPSTKPNIEKKAEDSSLPVKTFVSAKDSPKKSTDFNVPNPQQIKKLKHLLVSVSVCVFVSWKLSIFWGCMSNRIFFFFALQDENISTYLSKQDVLPLTSSYCENIFTQESQEVW